MRRRDLAKAVGAGVVACAPAWAQSIRAIRRLGVLATVVEGDPEWQSEVSALLQALAGFGWRDGANLQVEYRFGGGQPERLSDGARHLVRRSPDVLLARSTVAVQALA